MTVTERTVRDIALENPASIRVFEKFGIDYCCGGRKPLAEACAEKNVAMAEVIAALERAEGTNPDAVDDWTTKPLALLAQHIVTTHHAYVNREMPRLAQLAQRVVNRHGDTKPELAHIHAKVVELGEEMSQHQAKEEVVLFPHIARLERSASEGTPRPAAGFGTVANPIAMMTREHDSAGALMADIRELSQDYTPPAGACPTFHAFYDGLREFEQDLHQHIHLENNILFPRALALESAAS